MNFTEWIGALNVVLFCLSSSSGDISSLYADADHYWDFEQSPVSQITDQKTGTRVTVHENPALVDSPTGKAIYLQGTTTNSSIDLMEVTPSSCLFDPSNCTAGLSIAMFVKFRPAYGYSINNTQMFFGNSDGVHLRQGVSVYYNEKSGILNTTLFGSTRYCFRWLGPVRNSWTHLHVKWDRTGELNVYADGQAGPQDPRYVKCGSITTPLPTERMYGLGRGASPVAYFDNLAVWYQKKAGFTGPWDYLTNHNGSTTLSLKITLWDKQWANLGNISSNVFTSLKSDFIDQIKAIYNKSGSNNQPSQVLVDLFNSGAVLAHVNITFTGKTTWKDSLILQDSLEREGLLESNASITTCIADDGFFCDGLEIITEAGSVGRRQIKIKFKHVEEVNSHNDLMGYTVLYKETDEDEWWKPVNIRGGWQRDATVKGLKPYTNYFFRVAPCSFRASGLAGPVAIIETLEDVPETGPVILESYSINRTTVFVRWNETSIPEKEWNGIPRGFLVHGRGQPCTGYEVKPQKVGLNVSSLIVTGLKAWVVYVVKISGVTQPGHGKASEAKIKTDESVPSQGPGSITISHTSNHSVQVTWDEVKICFVHGPVQFYEVHFRDAEPGGRVDIMHNVTVPVGVQRRLDFTNLEIYWLYGVRIKAFTSLGPGPLSKEITGRTDEWVPIVPPSNVSAFLPRTTEIRLSWYFENNIRDVLGILTGFRIFYQLANGSSAPEQRHEVGENIRKTDIAGLEIYRFYRISVAGKTSKGHGVISENVYLRTLGTAPQHSPVPIVMSNTSSTSLLVTWGEVPPAFHHGEVTGYRVRLEETGVPGSGVASRTFSLDVNNTEFTDLEKFTSYMAHVRAYSLFGEGPDGHVTALTDEDTPTQAPVDVQLFNTSSTSLKAVWGPVPVCCQHGIIRGYRLFLSDSISGAFVRNETLPGGSSEFEFSPLLKYYGYSFYILAFTIKGEGPLSGGITATTEEDVPVEPPFNVSARNTSAWSLLVEWDFDPNVRRVLGILRGYHVFYRNLNDSDALWESKLVWNPLARQTTLFGLEEYRDYNITVSAFTKIGDGMNCSFLVARTDEHVPRAPPSDITAINTSSTSLRVDWGDVPFVDQLGIIWGYRVLMWRTNQSKDILENVTLRVPSRNISFEKLEKYTNYTIQILAFTVKGDGQISEQVVVTTDEDIPTWSPTAIAARNTSSTSILVSWQPVADSYYLHGKLRGYTLSYERIDGHLFPLQVSVDGSDLSLELTDLDEYVQYRIEVRAFTTKGSGPYTHITCLTDEDVPAAPPRNVYGFNISKHDIQVFWEEVPYRDVNGIILEYRIYFNETWDGVFNKSVKFPTTNTTLSLLKPYTFYSIQVLAITIKGDGPKSPPVIVRTEEEAPQEYPWNVTGHNSSSTSIFIEWSRIPPEKVAGVLREYRIVYHELSYDGETAKTHVVRLSIDQLFVNLEGLAKYRNYTFEVQGLSKFFGVRSPPIVVITDQDVPSSPPLNISSTNTSSTSLLITWDPIPRIQVNGILLGYRVFYHQSSAEQQNGSRRQRRAIQSLNQTVEVLPPNATFLMISNLKKFTYYSFRVVGFTSKGEGKISRTFNVSTDEDVPSKPPERLNAVNLSGPHTIPVAWEPVPDDFVHGILLGYRVLYRVLKIAGDDTEEQILNKTTDASTTNIVLKDLHNYAVYEIRVTAFTVKGDGAVSRKIVPETCRCPLKMTTNWFSISPYITRQEGSPVGTLPSILNEATRSCCTPCINGHGSTTVDYENDKEGKAARKDNESVVHKIENEADMSFPIEGYKGQTAYGIYRYVPLMESGGVALVGLLPSPEERTSFVILVGTTCFPMLLVTFLMITIAGSVMWVIESRVNQEEFPRPFIKGLWEGLWWAYVTCTTLGYGDRIPRSFLGKSFAIVWTLFGLVIMSFLLADITSALISYSLVKATNKNVYGAKIGAIQASSEYRLGVRKTARMNPGEPYLRYVDIKRALENKEIEGALIDLYVLADHPELSSNPNLRVFKVFDYKKTYGVVLAGVSMKMEKCFLDFVQWNKGRISRNIEETVKTLATQKESVAEEVSYGFLDTSAAQFRFCVIISLVLLFVATVCGLIDQVYRTMRKPSHNAYLRKHLTDVRTEMRNEVNEFYRRFSEIVSEHKKTYVKEQRQFVKRRSIVQFYPIIPNNFKRFADSQSSYA